MKVNHSIFNDKRRIFWDVSEDKIPYLIEQVPEIAIPKIFSFGTKEEIESMMDYYGYDKVKATLQEQLSSFHLQVVNKACRMFNLKRENFQCFTNKQFLSLY